VKYDRKKTNHTISNHQFYFCWTWYANSLVSDDTEVSLRSALVQAIYSALMTLTFTSLLTWTIFKMKCHSAPFIGILPPLLLLSVMVDLVNYFNQTPKILLTIAPSIFFTAVYGIIFTFSLLKKDEFKCNSEHAE